MKTVRPQLSEGEALDRIAAQFEKQGYQTVVHPSAEQLPDFLRSSRPDLIATNEQESVVVEVKSRESIVGSRDVSDIARKLEGRDGWRFELVYIGGKEREAKPSKAAGRRGLQKRLRTARLALDKDDSESALLILWSIMEALLRHDVVRGELELDAKNTNHLVKQSYMYGVVGWKEYEVLQKALGARNRIAHGFAADSRLKPIAKSLIALVEDRLGRV